MNSSEKADMNLTAGELGDKFLTGIVWGIGIAVGARLLSFVLPKVVTVNLLADASTRQNTAIPAPVVIRRIISPNTPNR